MSVYYPYLRAKQYEVIAVDEATAALVQNGRIQPIFEPVRVNSKVLLKRATKFASARLSVGLVMNPQVGELVGSPAATAQFLASMRADGATVIPALIVDATTQVADLAAFAVHVAQGPAIYVHAGVPADPRVVTMIQQATNAAHVLRDGATSAAHEQTFAQPARKRLRDGFQAQIRNAAYPTHSFFSDLHLTYAGLGLSGFGDYATVGYMYSDSGGPAYAVAIHMTETTAQGVVCRHFLSISNTTQANPAGKFGEAVAALAAYCQQHPGVLDFSAACQQLLTHHQTGHFPGLGELKRLSIQHHLELMSRLVR
jgi:hypothetical protein